MTARTPGPWTRNGSTVSIPINEHQSYGAYAGTEANAAFIVRACNSHADLLEALETALDYVGDAYSDEAVRLFNVLELAIEKAT